MVNEAVARVFVSVSLTTSEMLAVPQMCFSFTVRVGRVPLCHMPGEHALPARTASFTQHFRMRH